MTKQEYLDAFNKISSLEDSVAEMREEISPLLKWAFYSVDNSSHLFIVAISDTHSDLDGLFMIPIDVFFDDTSRLKYIK